MTHYPQREGEPDCRDFIRTGRCKYGESCKYNHPVGTTALSDLTEPLPIRPNEPPCAYFLKHGVCKFGQTCKFHHPTNLPDDFSEVLGSFYMNVDFSKSSGVIATNTSVVMDNSTYPTLPQRPGAPYCMYYMRFGTCKFGFHCRYNHPLREEFINDMFVQCHDTINNRKDERGRSFSVGALLDSRDSNVSIHDNYCKKHLPPKESDSVCSNPNTPVISRDQPHFLTENTGSDHNNPEARQINNLNGLSSHDRFSTAYTTRFVSPKSQGLSNAIIRNQSRGRSLSNNDLYYSSENGYFKASQDLSKSNKTISSTADPFTTYRPPQSEQDTFSEEYVVTYANNRIKFPNQYTARSINHVSATFTRSPQSERNIFLDGDREYTHRFQDQHSSPNHQHNPMIKNVSASRHILSDGNRENERLLDQNIFQPNRHNLQNGSSRTLTCTKQLDWSRSITQIDDTMALYRKQMEWSVIFPFTASPQKDSTTLPCAENGDSLWKYP